MRPERSKDARDSARAQRSQLDYAVLSLVIEESSYGYEIWRRFEIRFGEALPAVTSWGVYRALKHLLSAGLVEASGERRRRVYSATEPGRDAFAVWWADEVRVPAEHTEMLVRVAATTATEDILRIVEEYERRCHEEIARASRRPDPVGVVAEILHDERQLRVAAMLAWASRTREKLRAAA